MILNPNELKGSTTLCSMCNAYPPEIVEYSVAEHGADLIICTDCAIKLSGFLNKDVYEALKTKVERAIACRQ